MVLQFNGFHSPEESIHFMKTDIKCGICGGFISQHRDLRFLLHSEEEDWKRCQAYLTMIEGPI